VDEVDSLLALESLEQGTLHRERPYALAEKELN
jgi:hypothetical protein